MRSALLLLGAAVLLVGGFYYVRHGPDQLWPIAVLAAGGLIVVGTVLLIRSPRKRAR